MQWSLWESFPPAMCRSEQNLRKSFGRQGWTVLVLYRMPNDSRPEEQIVEPIGHVDGSL